jgi:hypothetical protein
VGDPFKDTSGPSMNILIKLTCLVGLAIAPILGEKLAKGHSSIGVKPAIQSEKPALAKTPTTLEIAPSTR